MSLWRYARVRQRPRGQCPVPQRVLSQKVLTLGCGGGTVTTFFPWSHVKSTAPVNATAAARARIAIATSFEGSAVLGLTADSIVVAVEVVRVRIRDAPEDGEVAVGDVGAVEVRRRRRNADSRVRGGAVPARWRWGWRRWGWRRRPWAQARKAQDRVQFDRVRGDPGLPVVVIEERNPDDPSPRTQPHKSPRISHLAAANRRRSPRAGGRGRLGDHVLRPALEN